MRQFLGTYPCVLCGARVRIYDWLPTAVLCASCKRKVQTEEAKQESDHE